MAPTEVVLTPFLHQVGGSTILHLLDETTLCKPIVRREMLFYKTLPLELEKFTPKYKGTIDVSLTQDEDGFISYIGYPSGLAIDCLPIRDTPHIIRRNHVPQQPASAIDSSSSPEVSIKENMEYWNKRCFRKQCSLMEQSTVEGDNSKFILLENATHEFIHPCIIDLKMGTRQYGDDATLEKRQLMLNRCMNSTSSTLGVRACGMQVHNALNDEYVIYDKYCCRDLTEESFRDLLCNYLHNGHRLRTDIIKSIVTELRSLYNAIQKQDTFRFYSSSLLILYEGVDEMAPFTDHHHSSILANERTCPISGDPMPLDDADIVLSHDDSSLFYRTQKLPTSSKVVLRMIDFAHSTHDQFPGDTHKHIGPDRGYLRGLESLMRLFTEIKGIGSSNGEIVWTF